MNKEILKTVIFDQHEVIRNVNIIARRYSLDPNANYVVTGLRRAGKSTLLYGVVQDLVARGVAWNRIIYINFEDERLAEFLAGRLQRHSFWFKVSSAVKGDFSSSMRFKISKAGKNSRVVWPILASMRS